MKTKVLSLVFLVIIITTSSCGGRTPETQPPTPFPTTTSTPLVEGDPGINILITTVGEVQLKRSEWADYYPTAFGATINRGDLLYPTEGAQAVVLCDDLHLWTVPSGTLSGLNNGCPQTSEPTLTRSTSKIGSTRPVKTELSSIPYIISPRRSHLLSSTPILRWNQVSGATSYTVTVRGTDLDWSKEVETTEIQYPGEPPLKAGEWYSVIVESNTGVSSQEEDVAGLGFSPINQEDVDRIQADIAQLDSLNLSDQAYLYAKAQLYIGDDLITEAIEILEGFASQDNSAPVVYRTLGDLYYQVDLYYLAEERYLEAIKQAEQINDLEVLTESQTRLGEVYVSLGRVENATELWARAIDGYKRLGDTTRAEELAKQLSKLSQ